MMRCAVLVSTLAFSIPALCNGLLIRKSQLATTRDLEIAGSNLPAGRFSVWAIPEKDSWTVVFSSVTPAFHLRYTAGKDVLRVRVRSHVADHMESLAYYFPMVDGDSAVLALHWGKTVVPMAIKASQ